VRCQKKHLIGRANQGWQVATRTLSSSDRESAAGRDMRAGQGDGRTREVGPQQPGTRAWEDTSGRQSSAVSRAKRRRSLLRIRQLTRRLQGSAAGTEVRFSAMHERIEFAKNKVAMEIAGPHSQMESRAHDAIDKGVNGRTGCSHRARLTISRGWLAQRNPAQLSGAGARMPRVVTRRGVFDKGRPAGVSFFF